MAWMLKYPVTAAKNTTCASYCMLKSSAIAVQDSTCALLVHGQAFIHCFEKEYLCIVLHAFIHCSVEGYLRIVLHAGGVHACKGILGSILST